MDQVVAGVTAALRKLLGLPRGAGVLLLRRLRMPLMRVSVGPASSILGGVPARVVRTSRGPEEDA